MRVFFDTSAFVKRYIYEAGTDSVLEWCDRATEIGLSGIALPEIVSAFYRLIKAFIFNHLLVIRLRHFF